LEHIPTDDGYAILLSGGLAILMCMVSLWCHLNPQKPKQPRQAKQPKLSKMQQRKENRKKLWLNVHGAAITDKHGSWTPETSQTSTKINKKPHWTPEPKQTQAKPDQRIHWTPETSQADKKADADQLEREIRRYD
jgi:hypothetical protein